jgi:hypothetical protein
MRTTSCWCVGGKKRIQKGGNKRRNGNCNILFFNEVIWNHWEQPLETKDNVANREF